MDRRSPCLVRALLYASHISISNLTFYLVANNFWGRDDAGLQPMLDRMHGSKTSNDELKAFYTSMFSNHPDRRAKLIYYFIVRAAIEDEYARKLQALCRKPLGTSETGSLRLSLDVVRGETEAIAKAHLAIAGQMKSELEEPLSAFASGLKERRKIIQNGIERLHKIKVQQTQVVNKVCCNLSSHYFEYVTD